MSQPKTFYLTLALATLTACGGGSDDGGSIQAGPYSGSAVYRDEGEPDGGCQDFIEACFGSFINLQISEQFFADETSAITVEQAFGEQIGQTNAPASSVEFSQRLPEQGPCGFAGGDVFCSGVRSGRVKLVSSSDRVLDYDATISATCRSEEIGAFQCEIKELATLQD